MSLNKAILHCKERRKPYRRTKIFDPSCRNHGGCPWCEENRLHKFRDKHPPMREEVDIFGIEEFDPHSYDGSTCS